MAYTTGERPQLRVELACSWDAKMKAGCNRWGPLKIAQHLISLAPNFACLLDVDFPTVCSFFTPPPCHLAASEMVGWCSFYPRPWCWCTCLHLTMQHTDVGSSATSTVVAFAHHKYESPSKTILTGKQGEIRQNDELTWLLQGFQTPKSPGLCALGNESFGYFPSDSLVKHPELSSSQAPGSLSPGRGEAFGPKKADLTLRLGYLQARHRAVKARAATAGFFSLQGFFLNPKMSFPARSFCKPTSVWFHVVSRYIWWSIPQHVALLTPI